MPNTPANASVSPANPTQVFVRYAPIDPAPPPTRLAGPLAWLRDNLFSSVGSVVLTLAAIYLLYVTIPGFIRFLFTDAIWSGADREACLAKDGVAPGACWAFVKDRIGFFIYAFYPMEQRWRVDLSFLLGAVGVAWMLWLGAPRRDLGFVYFIIAMPLMVYGLLSGNNPLGFLTYPYLFVREAAGGSVPILSGVFTLLLLLVIYTALRVMRLAETAGWVRAGVLLIVFAALGLGFEALWHGLAMPRVGTDKWGGLMVTLVVAGVSIVVSLPLGILLALGRRSPMPVAKFFSVMFIEFVRGVPLITVLFMANTMLPLFLPDNITVDKLLRALVGISLFASAYMAEVVRAGLQALPKGQYEGAMAMGLGYWQMMRLIILPQALKVTIPNIVNTYIGLFKDTSLLLIVGIFDFLKAIEAARIDPQWAAPTTSATGYVFAALVYFAFCYGMSAYAKATEERLSVGDKR